GRVRDRAALVPTERPASSRLACRSDTRRVERAIPLGFRPPRRRVGRLDAVPGCGDPTHARALRRARRMPLQAGADARDARAGRRKGVTIMRKLKLLFVTATIAAFASDAGAMVPGGGPARTDCYAGFQVTTEARGATHAGTVVDCQDGDPSCDVDGEMNGRCAIGVSVCTQLGGRASCTPEPVTALAMSKRAAAPRVVAPPPPGGHADRR